MSKVINFYPLDAAKNPNNVLQQAIGKYEHVLLLGINADGEVDFRSDSGIDETEINWLLDKFKNVLMNT